MMNFSFPTRKLGRSIKRITDRFKDFPNKDVVLTVYGVNNETGVSLTGKQASKDLSNYIYVSGNQFVYNPYRVNIGSIGLTPKNFKGVVSPAYVVFETKNDLDSEYLLFYLKSTTGNNLIRWYGNRGGVRAALRYSDLCKLDIPDLTIEEQKKALIRFKAAQKEIDKLFHELDSQNGNINNLRQAILRLVVKGKLIPQDPNDETASVLLEKINTEKNRLIKEGKIRKQKLLPPIKPDEIPYKLPKSWECVRLIDVFDVRDGTHDTPKYQPKGIPLVTSKNLSSGKLDLTNIKYISTEDHKKISERSEVNLDDILFAMIGSIGNPVIVDKDIEFSIKNVALFKYYSHKLSVPKFLNLFLEDAAIKMCEQAAGGVQSFVSLTYLRKYIFPLPPLAEQKRIVTKVEQLLALCDELEAKLNQTKADSDRLMASVVHHLLSRSPRRVRATTPYKNDAAVVCFLLAEMEKLHRPTTEFFIQKHIFAAKHHLHLPVNSVFKRKVAGPWSQELRWKAIEAAIKMNWLRWQKNRLVPGSAFEKGLSHATMVLGESTAQIVQLVKDIKAFGPNGLERWTTVLKVVEDLKETQQPITRANIQHEINSWPGKSLKEIFAEESVDYTIAMMLKHKWLPTTAGQ